MTFGNILKRVREQANISKTDLAKKIGVSPSYIMNLEAGRKKPPPKKRVFQISEALSLSKRKEKELLLSATKERVKEDERWLLARSGIDPSDDALNQEITKALKDKDSVKVLLKFHSFDKEKRKDLWEFCCKISDLPPEKRKALLVLI